MVFIETDPLPLCLKGQPGRGRYLILWLVFSQGILAISLCAAARAVADSSRVKVLEVHAAAAGRNITAHRAGCNGEKIALVARSGLAAGLGAGQVRFSRCAAAAVSSQRPDLAMDFVSATSAWAESLWRCARVRKSLGCKRIFNPFFNREFRFHSFELWEGIPSNNDFAHGAAWVTRLAYGGVYIPFWLDSSFYPRADCAGAAASAARLDPRGLYFAAFALAMAPLHSGIHEVNLNTVIIACLCAGAGFMSTRPYCSGVAIALATCLKPQVGIFFFAYPWLRKKWKTAFAALGGCSVVSAGSLVWMKIHHFEWLGVFLNELSRFSSPYRRSSPYAAGTGKFQLLNLQVLTFQFTHNPEWTKILAWTLFALLVRTPVSLSFPVFQTIMTMQELRLFPF